MSCSMCERLQLHLRPPPSPQTSGKPEVRRRVHEGARPDDPARGAGVDPSPSPKSRPPYQVVDPFTPSPPLSCLDDDLPTRTASPSPLSRRRPPPAHPRKPRPAPAARRRQAHGAPAEARHDGSSILGRTGPSLDRLECLNHVFVLGERHLRHILTRYRAYYHQARTHLALDKDAPDLGPIQQRDRLRRIPGSWISCSRSFWSRNSPIRSGS
jgi:hypothetical protein